MENIKLNERLLTAVPYVRIGKRLADIGTDHGYLPIYLLLENKISSAIAADINRGPLEKADENIRKFRLESSIGTVLCDGLSGITSDEVDDIAIFGMGGELIMKIIDEASWVKDNTKRLILQPMTHPEKLRAFLAENGYCITDEKIVVEEKENKIYQIIAASYSGEVKHLTDEELLLGKINIRRGGEELLRLASTYENALNRRIDGKREAGADVSCELALIERIRAATRGEII